jgi:hypothetical protein
MPITLGAKVNSNYMNDLAPLVVFRDSFGFIYFYQKPLERNNDYV